MTALTDEQIRGLILETKHLPDNYRARLLESIKPKKGSSHSQGEIEVIGNNENVFFIKTRQNNINKFDFSVILVYAFPDSTREFRLCRYNGKTTPHPNKLEKTVITGFHIHLATERYQLAGYKEDAYAEPTDRYMDLHGALKCMIEDCNFVRPESDPMELF